MKNIPEKIYVSKVLNVYENPFTDSVEYIRKDIAEQIAKEFAEFYIDCMSDFSFIEKGINGLFTEFINNRNMQTKTEND